MNVLWHADLKQLREPKASQRQTVCTPQELDMLRVRPEKTKLKIRPTAVAEPVQKLASNVKKGVEFGRGAEALP